MPSSELAQQILAENEALREDVGEMTAKLDTLEDKNRHTRWAVYGLTVIVAAGGMAFGYIETNKRIDQQLDYDVRACERGNDTRAGQREMWLDTQVLLNRFNDKSTDKLAADLVKSAFENFPHRDCSVIREGKEPPIVPPPTSRGVQS